MTSKHQDTDFVFPLTPDVTLVNDLIVRRDILEQLPLPMGLMMAGEWVWLNPWARYLRAWGGEPLGSSAREMAAEAVAESHPIEGLVDAAPNFTVSARFHPVRDLDGTVLGAIGWAGNPMAGVAFDLLETAVLVAHDRDVIWTNAAAQRAFGARHAAAWDDLYGFPSWEDVQQGVTAMRLGDYRIRCLAHGPYVLVEAWRPAMSDDPDSIPMEQVASLVHEIRNPLAALSGYIEMSQLEQDAGAPRYYEEMMHEVDRLSRFTADLMAVARPMSVQPAWVALNDLVEHAWFAAGRGRRAKKRTVRLVKEYPEDQQIWADPDRMQQVVTNLVKNAVEAMNSTGSYVKVRCQETDDETVVTILDDGPGLPQDQLGRLFVSRLTTKDTGNGFGLLIVRRVVEAHGGTVRIVPNGETRIEVRIPRRHP